MVRDRRGHNSPGRGTNPEASKLPVVPRRKRLAITLAVERRYTPDREAMLAALRVVLGLPKAPPEWLEELGR